MVRMRFSVAQMVRGGFGAAVLCALLMAMAAACGRIPQVPLTRWEGEKPPDFSARKQCTVSAPRECEAACKAGDSEACGTIRAAEAMGDGGAGTSETGAARD